MPSKCFVCGTRPAVIDGWCAEDWNKEHALIKLPDRFDIIMCARCNRAKISGSWKNWDLENFLRSKAKISGRLDELKVTEKNGKFIVSVRGVVEHGFKPKTEEHAVIIKFNKVSCPECSRAAGGYYEAIVQLRGRITDSEINFFEHEAEKILAKDARAFYSVKEIKEGLDIKMGSASAANKLAELLKRRYRAEINKSYQLVSKKDSRDINRTIIAVRFK